MIFVAAASSLRLAVAAVSDGFDDFFGTGQPAAAPAAQAAAPVQPAGVTADTKASIMGLFAGPPQQQMYGGQQMGGEEALDLSTVQILCTPELANRWFADTWMLC